MIKSFPNMHPLQQATNETKAEADNNAAPPTIDSKAMFSLSYGLYLLTTAYDKRDNGCIINTVMQITDAPKRIAIAVNKNAHTHDMIIKSGEFNVSVLDAHTPYAFFELFGMNSGRDIDKFAEYTNVKRSANGLYYLSRNCCAYMSAKVMQMLDFTTHHVFIGALSEAEVLSKERPVTYADYHAKIKPKRPQALTDDKNSKGKRIKAYRCTVCGYVYEGDTLPDDYICPLCGHGVDAFEPIYED